MPTPLWRQNRLCMPLPSSCCWTTRTTTIGALGASLPPNKDRIVHNEWLECPHDNVCTGGGEGIPQSASRGWCLRHCGGRIVRARPSLPAAVERWGWWRLESWALCGCQELTAVSAWPAVSIGIETAGGGPMKKARQGKEEAARTSCRAKAGWWWRRRLRGEEWAPPPSDSSRNKN